MYLKSVKLAGFKSFVDPTTVYIRGRQNAIVGPNGCGKSNIVDAIRWVVGESSAKQLRGQSMNDVVFNGTSSRKPVGKAMVELHFDNSQGRVGGEYARYSEIVVRRELTRDGSSNYFLNGSHCRRRDIVDIFLGTGLGPRSYAIIEQGMISQLIEAKPEDLRHHFEEVAGISKYKERRRETENRMRHTQDNLERLNDVRDELDKQCRHLKRQANAAERYKVFKEEERTLSAEIKALQWLALDEQLKQHYQLIQQQDLLVTEKQTDHNHIETNLDQKRTAQDELIQQQQEIQQHYYEHSTEIARLEQQIQHQQQQLNQWQQQLQQSQHNWQKLSEHIDEHHEQIDQTQQELDSLRPEAAESNTKIAQATHDLAAAETQMREWQQQWDTFQEHANQTTRHYDVTQTKLNHTQQQLKKLEQHYQQQQQQLSALNIDELAAEIDPLSTTVASLKQDTDLLQQQLSETTEHINEQRILNEKYQTQLKTTQSALHELKTEHATLHALQQAALGMSDEHNQTWLEENHLTNQPRLGQCLTVDNGWEIAVETVLSGFFDTVCVENITDYFTAAQQLTASKITLIDTSTHLSSAPTSPQLLPTLASKINCQWPLQQWLHDIFIAENNEQALQYQTQLTAQQSIITREGLWFGRSWLRVNNQPDPQSGILQRERKLSELQTQIDTTEQQLTTLETNYQQSQIQLKELDSQREQQHQHYQQLTQSLGQQQARLSKLQTRLEQTQLRQQQLEGLIKEDQDGINTCQEQQQLLTDRIQELSSTQQQLQTQRKALQEQRSTYQNNLTTYRQLSQQTKQRADQLSIRIASNEDQLKLLTQTIERNQQQASELNDQRQTLEQDIAQGDAPLTELQNQLQQSLNARQDIEEKKQSIQQSVEHHKQELSSLEKERHKLTEQLSQLQQEREELKLAQQTMTVRQTTIEEQLTADDCELKSVIDNLTENANLQEWQTQLEKLTKRIQRLGAINLAAIDEYQTVTERKAFLDTQFDDLTQALEVLQTAIHKIDRETKIQFRDTFNDINQRFQKLFPHIFAGGHAELVLSDDDLLTTGIIVRAQPPGKRNSTIHMLSGGEKALTAISLVFAMFQLNPAPFCILDEVDAPLDDLNVNRFCQLVKEMAKETQFIVISHNKVTIEMADHLLGVTMQEPGVSRLVSVDMAAAIDMVAA